MTQPEQIAQALGGGGSDLKRLIKEVSREARKSRIPIFIAMLAAFLALVSMADGGADKLALQSHVESSNQFAYFQAKNIRMTDSQIAASTFEALGKPQLAAKWQANADRYRAEKGKILKTALAQVETRKVALQQSDYFGIAISMLQIAIVMASASLIVGGGFLMGVSLLLTAIAIFFTVNGFGLYFEVPTDPFEFYEWISTTRATTMAR